MNRACLLLCLPVLLAGCDAPTVDADAAAEDAGPGMDAGPDAGPVDAGRVDGGGLLDGGPSGTTWPVPVPGSPGTGPACPEPVQGPMGAGWPEIFVGVAGCDDTGSGTREVPYCTFARAFSVADAAPYIVTVLEGTYRQRSHNLTRPGTASAYFVVRADEGARPIILGSEPIAGSAFESAAGGLVRVDVSALENDPTGFWTDAGRRIIHVMEFRGGVRSHANVADLVEPGTWTKADAAGMGCGGDNAGCYIYMLPFADLDVASTSFEASQGNFFNSVGGHYQVVDGLTIRFTQSAAIFFEGAQNILIQNGDFAHNASGNDNAYNLRLWGADGALVRRNRVWDSRYWGGAVNSHGITFMVGGDEIDMWVCENEIFDIIGYGVSTKDGSSNVHVVGNYFHDIGTGVHTSLSRCNWRGCDVRNYPGGGYTIRENLFESCGTGVAIARTDDRPEAVSPSRIFNNLFVDTNRGVWTFRVSIQPFVRNNVFVGSGNGLYFQAGGTTTWPDYYIGQGFDSDFNLFNVASTIYVYANWSGMERAIDLAAYQTEYAGDPNSLEVDPMLDDRYAPLAGSPLLGSGDPGVYAGATTVDSGLSPRPEGAPCPTSKGAPARGGQRIRLRHAGRRVAHVRRLRGRRSRLGRLVGERALRRVPRMPGRNQRPRSHLSVQRCGRRLRRILRPAHAGGSGGRLPRSQPGVPHLRWRVESAWLHPPELRHALSSGAGPPRRRPRLRASLPGHRRLTAGRLLGELRKRRLQAQRIPRRGHHRGFQHRPRTLLLHLHARHALRLGGLLQRHLRGEHLQRLRGPRDALRHGTGVLLGQPLQRDAAAGASARRVGLPRDDDADQHTGGRGRRDGVLDERHPRASTNSYG